MDPRNPKRPDGDAGSNWAVCLECGRGGKRLKAIQHRKHCRAFRPPQIKQPPTTLANMNLDEGFDSWRELNVMD